MIGGNNYGEEECGNNNLNLCPPLMTAENPPLNFPQQTNELIKNVNSEAEKQVENNFLAN
uniref:Candidate secreted effector n=1 Tax=Meloidogyne incognita TaxID=6306 RepID=A0A914M3I1_MELIC